ncbi:MAG: sigma-70 family RNA polymerase sigma factor [bacterium]
MSDEAITELLVRAQDGDQSAVNEVVPLVYEELRRLAFRHLRDERSDHTLTPTALVHEAYMKLVDQERVSWQGRGHFLAVASIVMRRLLVKHARDRSRQKRGGASRPVPLPDERLPTLARIALPLSDDQAFQMVELDNLLARLESFDPRAGRVFECRFFGGLSVEETAAALDVSPVSVKRAWRLARAWIRRELGE